METSKIYVDADSLFDLRQGILVDLYKEPDLVDYLVSNDYNFREYDRFKNVSEEEFNDFYKKNRNKTLLSHSTITYILNLLKSKILVLERRNSYLEKNKPVELLLNMQGFDLTKEDIEHLTEALFVKLGMKIFITPISITNEDLTPEFLKNADIVFSYIYNSSEWLKYHVPTIELHPIKDNVVFFPSILYQDYKLDETSELKKKGFDNPFTLLEMMLSKVATVQFLPPFFYSNMATSLAYIERFNKENKDKTLKEILGD